MNMKSVFIRQGSTPVLEVDLAGEAIQDASVYITIDQGDRQLTKSNYGNDPEVIVEPIYKSGVQTGTKISVILSQSETLSLKPGAAKIQCRWVFEDGTGETSTIARAEITESLLKGVITYGR